MYRIKEFKTKEQMAKFVSCHSGKIEWQEIFINNSYGIEYRWLRKVY